CVRANNDYSDFFECPVGVRQGCVLSPTIFSLFINQLAKYITDTGRHGIQLLSGLTELFILLFADDVALLATTPCGLQNQLDSLKVCCDRLKMEVNKDKTKVMVFRKGGHLSKHEKWYYDGAEMEVVNKYSYLGFVFTTTLSVKFVS
ncbi:reverse transcriptase domain-containing protein, partial [Thiolapillus sp.]|uniref:reverse transcriptase domain-containing protein n=1 Tax=Thiolapillus sp. TaxID=2017437 RepID=UPI003AF8588F